MAKKKQTKSSRNRLPILLALIAFGGTVIAAFISSDFLKELVQGILPRPPISALTVRVADNAGKPIPAAKVLFFYSAGGLSQYTDSNGVSRFIIASAVDGNVRLIVEADNYEIYEKNVDYPIESVVEVRLGGKQATSEKVILRTVRENDSIPIDGVDVIVTLNGQIHRTTTDSDGFAVYSLPFGSSGILDVQISVNAPGYKIENQFSTLTPGRLQYILLTPSSLRVEIPNIPARGVGNAPVDAGASPSLASGPIVDAADVIGSGVEITQQSGGRGLKVVFLTPDSQPWPDIFIEVNEQITDANGSPSRGNRVAADHVNEQGELLFDIEVGTYVICPNEDRGYGWSVDGCVYDVQVAANSLTLVKFQGGQIEIGVVGADSKPWENVYIEVFTQKEDVNGIPVTADRVWSGHTANTGFANAWLTPGLYAISIDLRGYNWGSLSDRRGEVNLLVQKANKTTLTIRMGQIVIALRKADGSPDSNVYLEIFTQKSDVNDQSVTADRIWSGHTDNGGFASINLTKGLYTVKIGENILYNVPVDWGRITETDGTTHRQK
jgi:hypothetical protein